MRIRLSIIMLILLALSISGCLEQQVENGDVVEVNYIGMLENGEVFDTSYSSVAFNNSIPKSEFFQTRAYYEPLSFEVGAEEMVPGFEKAVIGMKVREKKTFTVTPEEGYGKADPALTYAIPRIQTFPRMHVENRTIEVQTSQFESLFGEEAALNKSLKIPGTNSNATVINLTSSTVSIQYDLKVGDVFEVEGNPWNETVVSLNETRITFSINLALNQTIQSQGTPWNSTVIKTNGNITLLHNAIPRTKISTMYGTVTISFNESMINLDFNPPLAGKNMTFQVELVNLTKSKK